MPVCLSETTTTINVNHVHSVVVFKMVLLGIAAFRSDLLFGHRFGVEHFTGFRVRRRVLKPFACPGGAVIHLFYSKQ